DVRVVRRFIQANTDTSQAPIYEGHGKRPEDILLSSEEGWWRDTLAAYNHLVQLGYEEIVVIGLSLGGVLALKLSFLQKVKAVIPMCTPMSFDNEAQLTNGFKAHAREYKQLERKDEQTIEKEIDEMFTETPSVFKSVETLITEVKGQLDSIYAPAFVIQAKKDEMINPDSAKYIYEHLESLEKDIKWYEKSGHVITLGEEREQLHEDILKFLDRLDWEQ